MAKESKKLGVEIPMPKINTFRVKIRGRSAYIPEKISERTLDKLEAKHTNKAKGPKDTRDPKKEAEEKIYKDDRGRPAIPTANFKAAIIDGVTFQQDRIKGLVKGAVQIIDGEYVPLKFKKKKFKRDTGRCADMKRTMSIIYRTYFYDWETTLTISHNANLLSSAQVFNLLRLAGTHVGIGGKRPYVAGSMGKGGVFGMFDVLPAKKGA
jgi:hypothetical protein